jgi:arylsulfatase A-like enzyme
MLMRVPGVEGGKRVSQLVEGVDIVPTLLELCGAPVPPHLQGTSLRSLIEGEDEPVKDITLMEFTGWKMVRSQEYRYIAHDDGREFLYDLNAEWGEYRDVSGEEGYAAALTKHRQFLIQRLISMERPRKKVWSY